MQEFLGRPSPGGPAADDGRWGRRAIRLFVGGHAATVGGERYDLAGDRMFSAAVRPERHGFDPATVCGVLDSGAFSDRPGRRLTPAQALERQLGWEERAGRRWGAPWQAHALVSYDLLIDEVWTGPARSKRRWSPRDAEAAVDTTVAAAHFLAGQRAALAPRRLVLSCQGVDAGQYCACVRAVLVAARPGDWVGFGGWCILGRWTSWRPEFWRTLDRCLPLVAAAGVGHVHLFGVLSLPALGGLLWLADRSGLTVSTDSTAPVLACTRRDAAKAGVRAAGWRANVAWWQHTLGGLRESRWYRAPPVGAAVRQLSLFGADHPTTSGTEDAGDTVSPATT